MMYIIIFFIGLSIGFVVAKQIEKRNKRNKHIKLIIPNSRNEITENGNYSANYIYKKVKETGK